MRRSMERTPLTSRGDTVQRTSQLGASPMKTTSKALAALRPWRRRALALVAVAAMAWGPSLELLASTTEVVNRRGAELELYAGPDGER